MTAVLKSNTCGPEVRSHRLSVIEQPGRSVSETDALRVRIEELEGRVAEAADNAKLHDERIDLAAEQARKDGHRQGLLDAAKLEEERLELLRAGMNEAIATFRDSISATESLAVLIARTCLETMFTTAGGREQLACDLIRGQLAKLTADSIVEVSVSQSDFADETSIASLVAQTGLDIGLVRVEHSMNTGDVVIRLGLGEVELGLDQQWGSLRDLLDEWVLAGATA